MEPLEYLRMLQRRWYLPVAAMLIGVAAAWALTPAEQEWDTGPRVTSYTATTTLYRDSGAAATEYSLEMMAVLARTGDVPGRVAERLGENVEPAVLVSEVDISGDSREGTLTVSASGRDGDRAALLANTFAEEIIAYFDEQELARQAEQLERAEGQLAQQEERITELDAQMRGAPEGTSEGDLLRSEREALIHQYGLLHQRVQELTGAGAATAGLVTLQEAVAVPILDEEGGFEPPEGRGSRAGIAAVIGLILGVGLVLVIEQLDTRIRNRKEVERAFGVPVITEVPKLGFRQRRSRPVVTVTEPGSYGAEAYRILRVSLQLMPRWILPNPVLNPEGEVEQGRRRPATTTSSGPATVILVTSPGPGEGKSTTVANLAASFAEVGKIVLVLDCDLRHPDQHRYFNVDQELGVTDYLASGGDGPALEELAVQTELAGVWLVPGGSPADNPGRLLGPDQDLIASAAELADVVLVDAGPLLAVNDPSALIPRADAVVVVARSGQTTTEAAHLTSELLARLEAPIVGVALVGIPRGVTGRHYHPSGHASRHRALPERAEEQAEEQAPEPAHEQASTEETR